MCVLAFSWGASERFALVLAANRDEFFARPTAALGQWSSPQGQAVLGGRDLRDGGTWIGFSQQGRFAMLTNVRNPLQPQPEKPISRGHLVLNWLEGDADKGHANEAQECAQRWMQSLAPERYQGFNLIIGDWAAQRCYYLSNPNGSLCIKELAPGAVYGLSNAALDTPWPKTLRIKAALQTHLSSAQDSADLTALCLQTLQDTECAPQAKLPRTGVPLDLEHALSSVFVRYPAGAQATYGTRSSLVAVCDAKAHLCLTEVSYAPSGTSKHTTQAQLNWPAHPLIPQP